MSSGISFLPAEAPLVAITPSRVEGPLRDALSKAAQIGGLQLLDAAAITPGMSLPANCLVVCADVSTVDPQTVRPLAVVLGEWETADRWVAATRGGAGLEGLMFAARCFAHATHVAKTAGARVFSTEDFLVAPEQALATLLRHVGLSLKRADLEGIAVSFGAAVRGSGVTEAAGEPNPFAEALAFFVPEAVGRPKRARWDRILFRCGDDPDQVCPESLDVTGAARVLVFGPFITLTAGVWRADVMVDVCEQAARRFYLLEFGAGSNLSRVALHPLKPGRNVVSIEHPFDKPAEAELRFWVARAAFHGNLHFGGAVIERRPDEALVENAAADGP
jgi:hypothetical protein